MKLKLYIFFFLTGLLIPKLTCAQAKESEVEESAEVFLEEYSDDFQEFFFEALKQKGIENYDNTINLLLKCKQIDAANIVVNHELAKAYLLDKKYMLAQEYGVVAVNAAPDNLWYLNTLMQILNKQGNTLAAIKSKIPYADNRLQENLALVYYRNKKYKQAQNILKGIKKTPFTKELSVKIEDSLQQIYAFNKKREQPMLVTAKENPLDSYKAEIGTLISKGDFLGLEKMATEALESFPSQPYFYYVKGLSLNKKTKHNQAISALKEALNYLLDDQELTNKINLELANAYTGLGNTSKANMYLSKIKTGI